MTYLNLGCGLNTRCDSVNVDVLRYPGIDKVYNLTKFPWPWEDQSVDGIYASHVIEHFKDQKQFNMECYRILKPGGFLRINAPHSSSAAAIGCMGHYRTYSYATFQDYLSRDFYMFDVKRFDTVEQKLLWWYEKPDTYRNLPKPVFVIIRIINPIINFFARLSPRICENVWCYWVGGFREVIWKGVKV